MTAGSTDTAAADLRRIVGDDAVSVQESDRSAYAHDLWPRQLLATRGSLPRPPGPHAIVWPTRDEHIAEIIRWSERTGTTITPFGAGSAVTGAISLDRGTVAVDMKRMHAIHSVDLERGRATIDAGMLGQHLEESLQQRGATLGHFPSSIFCSTLGGWIATRGAGQCSGRYGKIEDMVFGLEGVLPTGEPFRATPPVPGSVDARPLLVGSEGLFGFITRATMRVWPAPTLRRFASFTFGTMAEGWETLRQIYQAGLRPAVARLYDPFDSYVFRSGARSKGHAAQPPRETSAWSERLIRRALSEPRRLNALNVRFGARAFGRSLLIVVFEGTGLEPLDSELERAEQIARDGGGRDEGEALGRRWLARRHAVSYKMPGTFARGLWVDTMEVAAPWSRLAELYAQVGEALARGGFVMAHMSHAYPDGCAIYFTFAGGGSDDALAETVYHRTWREALAAAHRAGGTVAHHHGIGRSKRGAMRMEIGAGVDMIEQLARAADPRGVMSRGVLIPDGDEIQLAAGETPHDEITIDTGSRLARGQADCPVAEFRERLDRHGLALPPVAADSNPQDIAAWLRMQRAWEPRPDPVDHIVAGFSARRPDGSTVRLLPAPRRAAGPDLLPLLLEADRRFGALDHVTLRVHAREERPPPWTAPFEAPSAVDDPALASWIARASR